MPGSRMMPLEAIERSIWMSRVGVAADMGVVDLVLITARPPP
jgi:hypothetical protein